MNLSALWPVYICETGFNYKYKGGNDLDEFEKLLETNKIYVERFVKFKIALKTDAEDVLQEIFITAYQKFPQLKNKDSFKAWIISIAKNKCNDYFRKKASQHDIPINELIKAELADSRYGISVIHTVRETLSMLGDKDKQILYMYFWKEMPQAEIAKHLNIPVGTVKSRLHTAKNNFKNKYPHQTNEKKGKYDMKKLPEFIPQYKIEKSAKPPFAVKWEELMGWFLVPKLGENISWGLYDIPSRKCSITCNMQVTGKATVHGIEGVEISAKETELSENNNITERKFVAQLTDTHCRYLATMKKDRDICNYITFLDADDFLPNWGFGEDNCGNEVNLSVKGNIIKNGSEITSANKSFLLDIVGRYTVTIGDKTYDTVCVMDIETYDNGIVSEQYLDKNGRTVLWRRFNRNDWAMDKYGKTWSEMLPNNEKLNVNGTTYVHWYDCITDYIL